MAPAAICPTCSTPASEGVCPRCALAAALEGLTALASDVPSPAGQFEAPAGYELLHQIGAGATAEVWLAREQKLDRLVALKFISARADRRLTQRLIREGKSVARLRHPHIVAVHALGVSDRQAYLAMDFVAGGDLRQRLARGLPSPREASALGEKLAGALAHAHASGLLHRDIKPSNVLLDPDGEPHLADFGLAAPIQGGGDLTLPGQVAGTAAYLAPELLAGAEHASPLSDVYGLGALLYECLTGRPPFLGDSAAAIFAQLSWAEPPPPRLLRPDIPADLETICLKCLEKTPAQRYASAAALQDDLGRFQRGEPIMARPVGFSGRAVRWCRRNPATAAFAGIAGALLLGLALGGPLVALRLARAKAQAAEEAAASRAVSEFLRNDLLAQAAPDRQPDRELKLRTVLDRAAKNIDGRFPHQPLVEADLRETLATTYRSLGEYESARQQWLRVRDLRQRWLGPRDPKTLDAAAGLFRALKSLGQFHDAEGLGLAVTENLRHVLGPAHPDTVAAVNDLAGVYRLEGKLTAAETLYVQLLALTRDKLGPEHTQTLSAMNNLALTYQEEGKLTDAEALLRDEFAIHRRNLGPEHPSTLGAMYNLALICSDRGNMVEAEALCAQAAESRSRVLGPDHPDTLHAIRILAWINQELGKLDEAETRDLHVLALQKRKLGAEHPDTLVTRFNLARLYRDQGRLAEAESLATETLETRRRVLGPQHLSTLQTMTLLAAIYGAQGRLADASALAANAVAVCERKLGPVNPATIVAWAEFGRILVREGRFSEAEPLLQRACERLLKVRGDCWRTAVFQSQLGQALLGLKRYAEAEPVLLASYEVLKNNTARIAPASEGEVAATAARLAQLYSEWNRAEQAQTWRRTLADVGTGR